VPTTAKKASTAVWRGAEFPLVVVRETLGEFIVVDDVLEELVVAKELAALLIPADPFAPDGM
jgi:hypothetical protein